LEVTGGSFLRDGNSTYPATISSFTMDKYEVTVSRMANYVIDYLQSRGGPPALGAGKNPHNAQDPGWKASYSAFMPKQDSSAEFVSMLNCTWPAPLDGGGGAGGGAGAGGGSGASTGGAAGSGGAASGATYFDSRRTLPANCVTFYVAYAFCIWDGGRLPTEAEWNYAATGGDQQRYYPWSPTPTDKLIDTDRAVFGTAPLGLVGVKNGAGRYGQLDLAGNVSEWTSDYFLPLYPQTCVDCLTTTVANDRSLRGGSYVDLAVVLSTPFRNSRAPNTVKPHVGLRCVHDLVSN
jgi:formylglycine-generating enzyme required for sulfatase activity